jgi:hypothetical protein
MGIWSSIKKVAKKVWRAAKAVVRFVVRVVVAAVMLGINVFDFVFGFFGWPQKKLTLHVIVLPKFSPADRKSLETDLQLSIAQTERILRERFSVKLRPYVKDYVETYDGDVPPKALKPSCCGPGGSDILGQEFLSSGEFYAQHTAGWNGSPVSLRFPVTVFVVEDVLCRQGCAPGVLGDFIVIEPSGLSAVDMHTPHSLMMHEIGHACSLWHSSDDANIMHGPNNRGDGAKWFQKNLLRSSRHVTYW